MSWCFSCFTKTYEAPEVLELDYRHSTLTEVPAEVFTFERTLEKLYLGSNQIADLPPSLFHCHGLKELDLCDNDLTTVPAAIGSLTRLWRLDLSRNAISEVSDTIKNCKALTHLDLSLNHLVKLPEGVSQLVNLEELFLNDTYLEFLHANFGRLTKLKVLELRENSIQTLPKSMSRLSHLQRLDVGQNDLYEFPEVIGTMTSLTELWCDNNNIRSLSKVIGTLTKLNCLDASNNDIREIADEISKCNQLVDVTLAMNNLESLPDTFPKLESLSVLRLDSNSIQYLPEDFGNMKSLQELSLIRNLLKALPPSFGLLRKLHTLYLDDNLLPELPKEIGSCSSLTVLSVSKNRLTGIPSEFGHLSSLKVLSLAGNHIVNLPVSILNIPLWALWLSESQTKPLLQLNQEVDPRTGQHVLTCFLLPQMPYSDSAELTNGVGAEEAIQVPVRRSRPSIKFVTDSDPPVVDTNVNKRGLLRAPTPYPKELRALAKHASHLRQSRENGDIMNTDEPEYEGDDYNEDDDMETDRTAGLASMKGAQRLRSGTNGGNDEDVSGVRLTEFGSIHQPATYGKGGDAIESQMRSQDQLGLPEIGSLPFDYQAPGKRSSFSGNIRAVPQVPTTAPPPIPVETVLSKIEESNKRSAELGSALGEPLSLTDVILRNSSIGKEPYGSSASELVRKSPPPYQVAARRAAFFRSSALSGSSIPPPKSPRLAATTPTESITSSYIQGSLSSPRNFGQIIKSTDDPVDDLPTTPLLNRTYIIESNDGKESSISLLESEEVHDDDGVKVKQTVETKSESEISSSRILDGGLEKEKWLREKNVIESIVKSASELGNTLESTTKTSSITTETLMTLKDTGELVNNGIPDSSSSIADLISPSRVYPRSYSSVPSYIPSAMPIRNTTVSSSSTDSYSRIPVFASTKSGSSLDEKPLSPPVLSLENNPSSQNHVSTVNKNVNISEKVHPVPPPKPVSLAFAGGVTNPLVTPLYSNNLHKIPTSSKGVNINNLNNKAAAAEEDLKHVNQNVSIKSNELSGTNNNISAIYKPALSRTITPPSRIPSVTDSRSSLSALPPTSKELPSKLLYGIKANSYTSQPQSSIVTSTVSTSKIPKVEVQSNSKQLKRTTSGSRIPMKKPVSHSQLVSSSTDTGYENSTGTYSPLSPDSTVTPSLEGGGESLEVSLNSNLPSRKPWIFGTHRNALVVNLEHTKVNGLGFSVCNGYPLNPGNDGQGIYIENVDAKDSRVKAGDKILQVDGIDVGNMTLDIVRKIIGNCQETFSLLVSRQN